MVLASRCLGGNREAKSISGATFCLAFSPLTVRSDDRVRVCEREVRRRRRSSVYQARWQRIPNRARCYSLRPATKPRPMVLPQPPPGGSCFGRCARSVVTSEPVCPYRDTSLLAPLGPTSWVLDLAALRDSGWTTVAGPGVVGWPMACR